MRLHIVSMASTASMAILLCAISPFYTMAETHELDKEKSVALLEAAAREGINLPVPNTVSDSVGVTAVLLTKGAVGRLFGNDIANTYVVVQLVISNKSLSGAFVLHSAYLDTSQWALGGGRPSSAKGNQISSVEARVVRGQVLDAQQWSARDWTVRLLTVAGSVASGYTFAFKETGVAKGIAAFSGSFVPGVASAWPDSAVAQLNRISDLGYQTNKSIARESADVIVCFFPIDMFLSKQFRKLFLDSPGLFLSPYQILYEDKLLKKLHLEHDAQALLGLLPCYSKQFEVKSGNEKGDGATIIGKCSQQLLAPENEKTRVLLDYIGRFGLENVGVHVDGIMTVDVDTVPASIDDVAFANDATQSIFWSATGLQSGTLLCRFCQGGQVDIVEKDKSGIRAVTTAADSTNNTLNFTFTVTRPVPSGKIIHFTVTKPGDRNKGAKDVTSAPFAYSIDYPTALK